MVPEPTHQVEEADDGAVQTGAPANLPRFPGRGPANPRAAAADAAAAAPGGSPRAPAASPGVGGDADGSPAASPGYRPRARTRLPRADVDRLDVKFVEWGHLEEPLGASQLGINDVIISPVELS